jgi:hypothetical protein
MNWRANDEQNHLIGRVGGTGHVYILGGGRAQSVKVGRGSVAPALLVFLSYSFATLLFLLCLCSVLSAHLPWAHLPRRGGGAFLGATPKCFMHA